MEDNIEKNDILDLFSDTEDFWNKFALRKTDSERATLGFELSLYKWERLSEVTDEEFESIKEDYFHVVTKTCGLCFESDPRPTGDRRMNCVNCLFDCWKKYGAHDLIPLFYKIKKSKTPAEFRRLCKRMRNYIYNYVTGEGE